MAKVLWPDKFPTPKLLGYSIVPDETIARTQMDAGVARQRRRFSSVPSIARVKWVMTHEVFGFFESWYRHKAKEGAEWIEIKLMNGMGFDKTESRFTKPYTSKMLSNDLWEVSALLEVRQMNVLTDDAITAFFEMGLIISEVISIDNLLHNTVYIPVDKRTNPWWEYG